MAKQVRQSRGTGYGDRHRPPRVTPVLFQLALVSVCNAVVREASMAVSSRCLRLGRWIIRVRMQKYAKRLQRTYNARRCGAEMSE